MKHYTIKFLKRVGDKLFAPHSTWFEYKVGVQYDLKLKKNKKALVPCSMAFHSTGIEGLKSWFECYRSTDLVAYIAEVSGIIHYEDKKFASERIKLIKQIHMINHMDFSYSVMDDIIDTLIEKRYKLLNNTKYQKLTNHGKYFKYIEYEVEDIKSEVI